MATEILDLSLAYNCGATSHWAVRSYANAHQSGDVPNATMFGITDGPGFPNGTFAGMRVCGTRDGGGVYNNYDLHFATHWGGVIAPTVMTMTCGGNVGIGTTTPSTILNIASSSPKIRLNPTTQNNPTAIEFGVLNAGTCAYAKIDAVNAQNYDTNLRFFTNGAGDATQVERMRITYTGVVGIGTSSPSNHQGVPGLTVSGTSGNRGIIEVWDGTSGKSIFQQVGGSTYIGQLCKGSGAGDLYLLTGGNGTAANVSMFISCAGNVGIGTSSPTSPLHLRDSTNGFVGLRIEGSGTYAGSDFTIFASALSPSSADDFLGFYNNSTTDGATSEYKFRLFKSGVANFVGNVGVGTTSPAKSLHVIGTGLFSCGIQTCGAYGLTDTDGTRIAVLTANYTAGVSGTGTSSNNDFALYTNASERMRVTCAGCVGVGTASPSYRLHVNGTFYAAGSSQDYKQSICNYNTDSCMFMKLKPVTYQYKEEYCHLGKELKSGTQIGLIAEEVAETYPELAILVNEEENKVVRNVDYEKLSVILLSEVQKLRREVDDLKHKQ